MTEHVQVAVIGGGIVGCSVLFGLAERGWSDAVLLERMELTSGSTWHAAGNVTYFGHYASITRLYIDSIRAYLQAEKESGLSVGFHAAGSLRLASTDAELAAYRSLKPMYRRLDVPFEIVDAREVARLHPLLATHDLAGAAHTPTDGHVDASGATQALAKAARLRGARVRRHSPVHTLERTSRGWLLTTPEERYLTEHVVVATSFWAREMLLPLGIDLPLYALEHHELITAEIPELKALGFEVPTVRDPRAPSNTRQEGDGFLCGIYEAEPRPWSIDGVPADFGPELLPPDIERLEEHMLRVAERLPAFGTAGIKAINNGPICYAPDGCPLLGPVSGHDGLWLATGFAIGIGTGGGSGAFLAHWMTEGAPPYDLPIVHPDRFAQGMTRDSALKEICATYARGYVTPTGPA